MDGCLGSGWVDGWIDRWMGKYTCEVGIKILIDLHVRILSIFFWVGLPFGLVARIPVQLGAGEAPSLLPRCFAVVEARWGPGVPRAPRWDYDGTRSAQGHAGGRWGNGSLGAASGFCFRPNGGSSPPHPARGRTPPKEIGLTEGGHFPNKKVALRAETHPWTSRPQTPLGRIF